MIRRVSSSEGCRLRPRGDQKMDRDTQVGLIGDQSCSIGDAALFARELTISEGQRKPIQHTALLVEQGRHRFYTLVLPSSLLAASCAVETRNDNPENGFQRLLDARRAKSIARYIDSGFGTVPGAIVLSAQACANLNYDTDKGLVEFEPDPRAFLIIDGQHRVYGFKLAKKSVSTPVIIYDKLSRAQECRLFMDINTKQKPVPNELLLDIRRLSEVETKTDALFHSVFDLFNTRDDSALAGLLSPAEKRKGLLSRVTFNAAMRSIKKAFDGATAEDVYQVFNAYLTGCRHGLGLHGLDANIANPAMFKALALLFINVAERVADRHDAQYTVANFEEVLIPFFRRLKKSDLPRTGLGPAGLYDYYNKALSAGFLIKQWIFA